jgi:predicted nucleic acid-binding protein
VRIVTAVKVVDASALAALVFGEPAAEEVSGRLRGGRLAAPNLLGYELANTCLKKIRARPAQRALLLQAFAGWPTMGVELVDIEHGEVLSAAEQFGLTSYDASYLWLAQRLDAELVTLDRKLARAAARLRSG